MQEVQHFCVTFFIEIKFESYHPESCLRIEIEKIQNIKHMNIQIIIMNITPTLVFSDFYINARKSTRGQKSKNCKISRFLFSKVLILVVVIYILILLFILSSGPQSVYTTFG